MYFHNIFSLTLLAADFHFHILKQKMPFEDIIKFLLLLDLLYPISNKSIAPSKDFPELELQIEFLTHIFFIGETLLKERPWYQYIII